MTANLGELLRLQLHRRPQAEPATWLNPRWKYPKAETHSTSAAFLQRQIQRGLKVKSK